MLIESPSLSLEYYLIYELYFFSPRWRHRTHQLLIKARFGPILLFFSVEIQLAKNRELFQIYWIPLVFSVYPERV